MKPPNKTLVYFIVMSSIATQLHGINVLLESQGEFVATPFSPTVVVIGEGVNTIRGDLGDNGQSGAADASGNPTNTDADFFTVTVPVGTTMTLEIREHTVTAGTPNRAFLAYKSAQSFDGFPSASALVLSANTGNPEHEAWLLFDDTTVDWRDAVTNAPITAPVFTAGDYVFWLQETTAGATLDYAIDLIVDAGFPAKLPYQGRVSENGVLPTGTRYFKFALANDGVGPSEAYWNNEAAFSDGNPVPLDEPTTAVSLAVTNGLFSVTLGDTTLSNMVSITDDVWQNDILYLRVWYSEDSTNGTDGTFALLETVRLVPSAYAHRAAVADSVLSVSSIAPLTRRSLIPAAWTRA